MEPSRCKTTSTVTIACEHRPRPLPKHRGARESKTQYMTYSWRKGEEKRQNSNIQPYKIIRRTSVRLSVMHAVRETAARVRIEKIFFTVLFFFLFMFYCCCFFLESWSSSYYVEGPCEALRGPATRSQFCSVQPLPRGPQSIGSDWTGVGRKASILLCTRVIIDLNPPPPLW